MTRGDLVTLAINGDYGKPRPALIIQSDEYADLDSVTVLRLTSDVDDQHMLRVTVVPSAENGLKLRSQIMIDKAATTLRERIGRIIGRLEANAMRDVDQRLARFLGLIA